MNDNAFGIRDGDNYEGQPPVARTQPNRSLAGGSR